MWAFDSSSVLFKSLSSPVFVFVSRPKIKIATPLRIGARLRLLTTINKQ